MTNTKIKIQLKLLADAMPGSGVGTELINDLVPRNHLGQPVIPASHLKGLVRQWLLDFASIRGYPIQEFLSGILGHPGTSIGEFGADGCESLVTFEDFVVSGVASPSNSRKRYITRTSLNQFGTVERNSLRTNEALSVGTIFEGVVHSQADKGSWQDLAVRLALLSLDAIGSSRNRGAGYCLVEIQGESRTPKQLLKELHAKQSEFGKGNNAILINQPKQLSNEATWLELTFVANSSICCPEYPTSSSNNLIQTGFVIPASAVQGALLTILDRVDSNLATSCFESNSFRCWPLQPAGMTHEEAERVFPVRVPTSHRMSKLPDATHGGYDYRDSIIEPYDWRVVAKGSPLKGSDGVLLCGENSTILFKSGDMPRVWSAHGVHNGRATEADRNLFQVTALAPMVFKGLLACPSDVAERVISCLESQQVTFGRSRSVRGGGILKVKKIGSLEGFFRWSSNPELNNRVFVLQSPVAVPDEVAFSSAEEQLISLIPGEVVDRIVMNGIEAAGVQASARILFGWNRHGKGEKADPRHNRLRARRVITPGSVFVLKNSVNDLSTFLLRGIGDGKQEGLGNVLPHPGIATDRYSRLNEELPVVRSSHAAGHWGVRLYEAAPSVSPSQISHLAAIVEKQSSKAAKEYLERQLRGRSTRIWDRWKTVETLLDKLFEHPNHVVDALRVWQDLAVGSKAQREQV